MSASLRIFAILALSQLCLPANAARIQADIRDSNGAALQDAVVYAVPAKGAGPLKGKREVPIEQINRTFTPAVTVIQTGTAVNFPNRDTVRHHVYSFSPAKTFEIKLFTGVPATPVVFDKPGEVVIGCNIHDQMIAWILIVDTPHFAKSDKGGKAVLDNLPAGDYEIAVWHAAATSPAPEKVNLAADAVREIAPKLTPKAQSSLRR
jgi:plastocyanin